MKIMIIPLLTMGGHMGYKVVIIGATAVERNINRICPDTGAKNAHLTFVLYVLNGSHQDTVVLRGETNMEVVRVHGQHKWRSRRCSAMNIVTGLERKIGRKAFKMGDLKPVI